MSWLKDALSLQKSSAAHAEQRWARMSSAPRGAVLNPASTLKSVLEAERKKSKSKTVTVSNPANQKSVKTVTVSNPPKKNHVSTSKSKSSKRNVSTTASKNLKSERLLVESDSDEGEASNSVDDVLARKARSTFRDRAEESSETTKVAKTTNKKSKPNFDADEDLAKPKTGPGSEVDDMFFSLDAMRKFGEAAEAKYERQQKGGKNAKKRKGDWSPDSADSDSDGSDSEEIRGLLFKEDLPAADDLMYEDFFGEKPKGDSKSVKSNVEIDMGENMIDPGSFADFEKQLAETGIEGADEEEEEELSETEGDSEELDPKLETNKNSALESHEEDSDSDSSSCSWDKEEIVRSATGGTTKKKSDSDAKKSNLLLGKLNGCVPFSTLGDDGNLSDMDPEDRELELMLRKLGRSGNYTPGGFDLGEISSGDESIIPFDSEDNGMEGSDEDSDGLSEQEEEEALSEEEEDGEKDIGASDSEDDETDNDQTKPSKRRKLNSKISKSDDSLNPSSSSLAARSHRLETLSSEVERMEQELLAPKHWSLVGEASKDRRERNSLLELSLELPMSHFRARSAKADLAQATGGGADEDEDEIGEDSAPNTLNIEAITKQRILDLAFDNVVKKLGVVRPADKKATGAEDEKEILNFKKSKMGIADIYAEQYEEEIFGQESKANEALDKEKVILKEIFGKVMYKLDQLTNAHFTPNPKIKLKTASTVAALQMEDTVPTTLGLSSAAIVTDKTKSKQTKAALALKSAGDLAAPEERQAMRAKKKKARQAAVAGQIREGEMTQKGARERKQALEMKNKTLKKEKSRGATNNLNNLNKNAASNSNSSHGLSNNEVLARATELMGLKSSEKGSKRQQNEAWAARTDGKTAEKRKKAKF